MSQTNLIILMIKLLLLSTFPSLSLAVSYKTQKIIEQLKIPYCLDQFDHTCLECGYNPDLQVFTAPNLLKTACLPSKDGCTQFLDLKGLICDPNAPCSCGYSKDQQNNCVKGIENCLYINWDQTCQTCITTKSKAKYGGGLWDFGLSFDKKACLDNSKLTSFCSRYQPDNKTCASCSPGYLITPSFKCILPRAVLNNCEQIHESGYSCLKCLPRYGLHPYNSNLCITIPGADFVPDCAEYGLRANGVDFETFCITCPKGFFMTRLGCKNLYDGYGVRKAIDIVSGSQMADEFFDQVCIAYSTYKDFDSPSVTFMKCVVPATPENLALYPWNSAFSFAINDSAVYQESEYCRDFDWKTYTCKSPDACDFLLATYNEDLKTCSGYTKMCQPNCKIADNMGSCKIAHDGYTVVSGRAVKLNHIPGCLTVSEDQKTCDQCLGLYLDPTEAVQTSRRAWKYYRRDPNTQLCVSSVVDYCATYTEETGRCLTCRPGFTLDLNRNICSPETFEQAPKGVYGCQVWDGEDCTTPFDGFYCNKVSGYPACYKNHENCFQHDPITRACEICSNFRFIIVNGQCLDDLWIHANKYCKDSNDYCNCERCKESLGVPVNGKCAPWKAGIEEVKGCIVYSQYRQCILCSFGFLLTDNGQCYDLLNSDYKLFDAPNGSKKYAELCQEALTSTTCKKCDNIHFDVGFVQIEASVLKTDPLITDTYQFCIYNRAASLSTQANQALDFAADPGSKLFKRIPGCAVYQPNKNFNVGCLTPLNGWNFSLISNKILLHPTQYDGSDPSLQCAFGKVTADFQCSACQNGYWFQASDNSCIVLGTGCLAQSDVDSAHCATPWPGYFINNNNPLRFAQRLISLNSIGDCNSKSWWCGIRAVKVIEPITSPPNFEPVECHESVAQLNSVSKKCLPIISITPNCRQLNSIGLCSACDEGYILGITGDNQRTIVNIQKIFCFPSIKYCQQYKEEEALCQTCGIDENFNPTFLDSIGNVCVSNKNSIPFCSIYKRNDYTTCLQCSNNGDLPDCKIPDNEFCDFFVKEIGFCLTCRTGYQVNYKGKCILWNTQEPCEVPFNSNLCVKCPNDFTKIQIDDEEISEIIGYCVPSTINGCIYASSDEKQCLRCTKQRVLLNGICVATSTNKDLPIIEDCGEIELDKVNLKYFCKECRKGYAIDQNRTVCVSNTSPCSDIQGGNDCAVMEEPMTFVTPFKCIEYRSYSSVISYFSALIFLLFII